MSTLSVILITKNEAKNITACLESVQFADEIIVLDSGSTDETVALAKQFTRHVYEVDWPGFGKQKNRALEKCTSEWVLAVDADEIVTSALQQEIKATLTKQTPYSAYAIPRRSTYCNRQIHFGDWRHDFCTRLFKRQAGTFKELPVHEALIVEGKVGQLHELLIHHSFTSLEDVLQKINLYSTLGAEYKFKQGKKSGLLKAIIHGVWTFFRGYFLKLGFLDGRRGFMLAFSNAEGCYYRYVKMMLLSEQTS